MLSTKKRGRPHKTTTVATSGKGGFGFFMIKCKYCDNTALVAEGTKQRICGLCLARMNGWYPIEQIQAMQAKKKEDQ